MNSRRSLDDLLLSSRSAQATTLSRRCAGRGACAARAKTRARCRLVLANCGCGRGLTDEECTPTSGCPNDYVCAVATTAFSSAATAAVGAQARARADRSAPRHHALPVGSSLLLLLLVGSAQVAAGTDAAFDFSTPSHGPGRTLATENDAAALHAFYDVTGGENWRNTSGWLLGDPCGSEERPWEEPLNL